MTGICILCSKYDNRILKKKCLNCYSRDYEKKKKLRVGKRFRGDYLKKYSQWEVRRKESNSRACARSLVAVFLIKNSLIPVCVDCEKPGTFHKKRNIVIGLEVSHNDQNPLNNDLSNLKLRCRPCHLLYDRVNRRTPRKNLNII